MTRTPPFAALALLLIAGGAGATTVEHLSIGELAARSERVFIGRVTDRQSRLSRAASGDSVVTTTTFAVDEVVQGPKSTRTFTLTGLGGAAGEGEQRLHQHVFGAPAFSVGERVLLFVERADTGRPVVTGMAQGKYRLVPDPKSGRVMAIRELGGLHLVRRRRPPDRFLLGAPQSEDVLPLHQLVALVRGERPPPVPVRLTRPAPRTFVPAEGAR